MRDHQPRADDSWVTDQLIAAAQQGDVESISAVVYSAHPHVMRFARSLCASPQDAEDAAQEALIILFRKVGSLRASAALASWMFRIVRNECLRLLRNRRPEAIDPSGADSVEDDVLRRLDADRVAAAIGALPDVQRRVLIMRDVQGYPGRSVADALGLSLAAMKSQLHRARRAVHAALREPDVF
ncbi:RNA polymerase sigma factor (sigma-70 family) [Kribbella voronezhensis]|uniref:RNA polymerase sigma factor (Sigma-70 family) n=1 Tax=Kribbella voronezhensis TaxID=2512212 RepID=A0A4R7TAT5_9ACTN|nr:RNA polymerase sigma factor [Kribbella voronezhensis]TDU88516.1 RNA polymerase sigma factor (sigma-70 family) [Kribbella voronezhensis]